MVIRSNTVCVTKLPLHNNDSHQSVADDICRRVKWAKNSVDIHRPRTPNQRYYEMGLIQ